MVFTFFDGAQNIASFFIQVYVHPVIVDGQTLPGVNIYANQSVSYCYYFLSLQSWIFSMKYLESAMFCSLTPPCVTSPKVRYINWAGIFIYTLVMLAMWGWCLITCPGYVYNDSLD